VLVLLGPAQPSPPPCSAMSEPVSCFSSACPSFI
jgi:hypothetical protein